MVRYYINNCCLIFNERIESKYITKDQDATKFLSFAQCLQIRIQIFILEKRKASESASEWKLLSGSASQWKVGSGFGSASNRKLDPDLLQTDADLQDCVCDHRLRMFRIRSGHVREQGGEGGEPLTAHGSGGRNRSSNSGDCQFLYSRYQDRRSETVC